MKNILVLMLGLALGILVAVPLTAMASSWSLPFNGSRDMAGMMSSMAPMNEQAQETRGQDEPTPPPPTPTPEPPEQEPSETHQRMHEMMDTMHGEGFSERMHEAMPESEEMMEQCASMMDMMENMEGMMNGMSGNGGMMGQ